MAQTLRREFEFTDRDFENVRRLVRAHTGIHLTDAKRDMAYSRLAKRLRHLRLASFSAYVDYLNQEPQDELVHFTNAVTTNLTSFFREPHHFKFLEQTLLPELIKAKAGGRRLRIWSAACSTGEEPYSIALALKESLPANSGWDARILATDLDTDVLETAKQGIYAQERVAVVDPPRLQRWFLKGRGANAGLVRATQALRDSVTFKPLNLMHPWPMKGPMDVIFCRNVFIYFDKPTQKSLVDRFAELLADDGHLFLGHSETLHHISDRFKLVGNTIYQKVR